MQYLAWPDHGVPSDRTLFMNFVDKMREMRQENLANIDQHFKQLQLLDVDASDVSPEEMIPTSVHQYISAANPPIIVHCKYITCEILVTKPPKGNNIWHRLNVGSAGIGRTGMLVLMDTALSFMRVNEPVYPLDIVKNMRDQRACMVQNVVSKTTRRSDPTAAKWVFPLFSVPVQVHLRVHFRCVRENRQNRVVRVNVHISLSSRFHVRPLRRPNSKKSLPPNRIII